MRSEVYFQKYHFKGKSTFFQALGGLYVHFELKWTWLCNKHTCFLLYYQMPKKFVLWNVCVYTDCCMCVTCMLHACNMPTVVAKAKTSRCHVCDMHVHRLKFSRCAHMCGLVYVWEREREKKHRESNKGREKERRRKRNH